MDTHGYRAELRQEEDQSWTAEVPELPGSVAAGMSPNEAIEELGDAVRAWLDAAHAEHRPIPRPIEPDADYSGRFVVRLGHSLHRALAVLAEREGVSLNSVCQTLLAYGVGRAEAPVWRIASPQIEVLTTLRSNATGGVGRTFLLAEVKGAEQVGVTPGTGAAPVRQLPGATTTGSFRGITATVAHSVPGPRSSLMGTTR